MHTNEVYLAMEFGEKQNFTAHSHNHFLEITLNLLLQEIWLRPKQAACTTVCTLLTAGIISNLLLAVFAMKELFAWLARQRVDWPFCTLY